MKNSSYPDPQRLARDEIRLIRISPGEWSDPVSCKLVRDSLSSVRPYHALSYAWGSAKITRPILLNGQPWNATVNLESALRHLRLQLLPTYLWVDALCINQIDAGERTHQVDLMGTIYRSCKGVLVYLGDGVGRHRRRRMARATQGDPPPIISFGLDREELPIICASAEGMEDIDKAYLDTLQVFKFVKELSDVGHIAHSDSLLQRNGLELFESLRQLTHAPFTPWWTRVWVVQEVVLPPEVTLICGSISASWSLFSRAVRQYNYHTQRCCSNVIDKIPRDCLKVLNSFSRKIQDLDDMRHIVGAFITPYTDSTTIPATVKSDGQRSLLSLMRRFKSRKASDPRDKVYALLSLVNDEDNVQNAMSPDYSLTEVQVFRLATLHSIYSSSSLSVLQGDISRKFRQDLPSWVPDWEASDYSFDNLRLERTNLYDSCSQHVINDTTVPSKDGILFVDCKVVDEVEFVGEVMLSEESDAVSKTIKDWCEIVEQAELSQRGPRARHQRLKKFFWRTLCADYIHDAGTGRRAKTEDECLFAFWMSLSDLSPFALDADWRGNVTQKRENQWHHLTRPRGHWSNLYLSENASIDRFLSALNMAVQVCDHELAGCAFKGVASILHRYVDKFEDVLFRDDSEFHDKEDDEFPTLSREDTILYGTSSRDDLMKAEWEQSKAARGLAEGTPPLQIRSWASLETRMVYVRSNVQKKETQAWKQMSWRSLLDHVMNQAKTKGLANFPRLYWFHQVSTMDRSIISATKSRRLFITKGGNIGLGPASTAVGDELCLLKGGRTPFILRNSTSEVPATGFELIGDCYADGLMDAETLDQRILEMHKVRVVPYLTRLGLLPNRGYISEWIWEKAFVNHPLPTWQKIGLV